VVEDDAAAGVRGTTEEEQEVTERNINGDVGRSRYRAAQKKAAELGLTPEVMEILAEGVREFDNERTAEARQTKALEKIASNTAPPRSDGDPWYWKERRLREREVAALELLAVLPVATDEEVAAIQAGSVYRRIVERLSQDNAPLA
jgi:hypothetical protein